MIKCIALYKEWGPMLPSHTARVLSLLSPCSTVTAPWGWRHEHPEKRHMEVASTLQVGTGAPKAAAPDTLLPTRAHSMGHPYPPRPWGVTKPSSGKRKKEGDHSKGAEKKKLSVKPEPGPSSRWLSSSEESSERKTA